MRIIEKKSVPCAGEQRFAPTGTEVKLNYFFINYNNNLMKNIFRLVKGLLPLLGYYYPCRFQHKTSW